MKNKNELHVIEQKYAINKAKVNELNAWPILRRRIYFEIFNKKVNFQGSARTRSKIRLLENFFYGFKHLFKLRKYDYVFFNNTDKRTPTLNQKRYDVFFDAWADKVGQEKSLFIEWAIDKHYPKKKTYSKNVISDLVFKLGCFFYKFITKGHFQDLEVIENIKKDYDIQLDERKALQSNLAQIGFYRHLFRIMKPKAIFLISSFTKEAIIIAGHLENIKVYETQHGYIGDNHQFYNSYYKFDQLYYPDYLLSFGNQEKANNYNGFIFDKDSIIPVGSLFLERIKKTFSSKNLEDMTKDYSRVFCVSLQNIEEEVLLMWISRQAERHSDWLFILKPRHVVRDYSEFEKLENCILLLEFNIYEILKYSHYNITIYSTTAVEASVFNVKTLFYNINNLSVKYFDVDSIFASLIEVGQDIEETHLNIDELNNKSYFTSDYHNNVANTNLVF